MYVYMYMCVYSIKKVVVMSKHGPDQRLYIGKMIVFAYIVHCTYSSITCVLCCEMGNAVGHIHVYMLYKLCTHVHVHSNVHVHMYMYMCMYFSFPSTTPHSISIVSSLPPPCCRSSSSLASSSSSASLGRTPSSSSRTS